MTTTSTVAGIRISHPDRVIYPAYTRAPRVGGMSALDDQSMAGVIMWVPGSLLFLIPAIVLTIRFLSPAVSIVEQSPKRPRPQLPPHRAFDLLHIPLVGAFLRAHAGRRALQLLLLAIAIAVIVDGFTDSSTNLAGVLPWTYWRAFTVSSSL